MKTSSIFTAATVLASMMVAVPASATLVPIYTMTSSVVSQKLQVSGCSTMVTGGLATTTFNRDDVTNEQTFEIVRTTLPTLAGTWSRVSTKTGYTVYLSPYNTSVGSDPAEPALAGPGVDVVLNALNVYAKANCSVKNPSAGNTVEFNQPSILVTKSVMTVKNAGGAATLSLVFKGKQSNSIKGKPKAGAVTSTTTIKGTVVNDPSCPIPPAACSVATTTM